MIAQIQHIVQYVIKVLHFLTQNNVLAMLLPRLVQFQIFPHLRQILLIL
jgi:hypothetical protein